MTHRWYQALSAHTVACVASTGLWKSILCQCIIYLRDSMYTVNKRGPREDPSWTPQNRESQKGTASPNTRDQDLLERLEMNHSRAKSLMPTDIFRWLINTLWSTVSWQIYVSALKHKFQKSNCCSISISSDSIQIHSVSVTIVLKCTNKLVEGSREEAKHSGIKTPPPTGGLEV